MHGEEPDFTAEDIALVEDAYWNKTPEALAERRRHFVASFKDLSDFTDLSAHATKGPCPWMGPCMVIHPSNVAMVRAVYRHPLGCKALNATCCLVYPE